MPGSEYTRPDPEALLRQIQDSDPGGEGGGPGRLKVFLGYFAGSGKSFQMFDEGRRRKRRGQDVVVGNVQQPTPPEVEPVLRELEIMPPIVVDGQPMLNVPAILQRRPQVCLVDALAYNNPPDAKHQYRWQDVQELLAAGISVITAVNLQYIAEYRDRVMAITGKCKEEIVPESFLTTADEMVLVDAPASLRAPGQAPDPYDQKLSALRELALLLAADVVDRQLESYLHRHGIPQSWGAHERILVCVTPRANGQRMIDAGRRGADRFHGELIVAHVRQPQIDAKNQAALDKILQYAKSQHATVEMLEGEEPIHAILDFARQRGVTQIFIGHTLRHDWRARFFASPVDKLIDAAEGIDVRVFPQ